MSKTIKRSSSTLSCKKKFGKNDSTGSKFGDPKYPNEFIQVFQERLLEETDDLPTVQTEQKTLICGNNKLPIITIGFENRDILRQISCKGTTMDKHILPAFKDVLTSFASLTELKFEFCNLLDNHIRELQNILKENSNITYMSLNGNNILPQNYYLLLENTSLKILSLQFCQINEVGAKLIGKQLAKPEGQTLIYLNIASNCLEDEGVIALSYGLRGNRTLAALNIADNRVTEQGILEFLNVFQRFPLKHEEIVYRRHKNLEYLKIKEEMKNTLKSQSRGSNKKVSENNIRKKSSADSMSRKTAVNSSSSSLSGLNRKINSEMDHCLSICTHPFVRESQPENKEIFCLGNNSLLHLNLSYNEITENVLNKLTEIVCYQKQTFESTKKTNIGLSRIIFAGKEADSLKASIADFYNVLHSATPCIKRIGSRSATTIGSRHRSSQLKSA